LFHWLSTNNQLSLLFVVNQRIFVHLKLAGLVAGSSRCDEVLLGIDF
jgi:hypothetical protein